jgi:hypothetical protein
MILTVPTFAYPSYAQTTTFEGTTYGLQFDYNQRCASWYLSVADQNGVDIYNGIKLMTGFFLLAKCKDPRRPPGELLVISTTSDLTPPAQYDLLAGSGRCQLVYITSDWMALLQSGQVATIQAQLAANAQASSTSTYGLQ